jgi:hypothetical protein
MTSRRRTEFAAFILDLMDFIEEKIGAIPVLRDRLRENEVAQANFILVLCAMIEARYASEWWEGFAKMGRTERVKRSDGNFSLNFSS